MLTTNAKRLIEGALIPLWKKWQVQDTVNGTVELLNVHLKFDPSDPIFDLGTHRKGQPEYVKNEKEWYLSLDRCIKGHPGIEDNKIWSAICTDDGYVNSNYGWCVFSPENGNGKMSQYDFALEQLKVNGINSGRQSIIYYSRPQMQWEWNDGIHAKKDFTCTINTQHFLRNDKLEYIVNMRSNDVIRGLHCGDLPWHCYVYNKMFNDINKWRDEIEDQSDMAFQNCEMGTIYWNAASLHCYERDYQLLDKIVKEYIENVPEGISKWL